ncbi:MAG: Calx-beta domain-containing protein, partial [Planctomycetaceae bacterium]
TVVAITDTEFVSIDGQNDTDIYSFTVAADASVSLSLSPVGPTYQQGRQDGVQSSYDAASQSDLSLQLLGTDGSVLETRNATGIGSGESVSDFDLDTAGTYFVRITGATENVVQLYELDVTVVIDVAPSDVSIVTAASEQAEGNTGTTDFTFTVNRTGDTTSAATVDYAVTGISASAADFAGGVFPGGTVNFEAGATSATITISVLGDLVLENDESFEVRLTNPSGVSIDTATAVGTILNDDVSISIAAADASQAEGDSGTTQFTFTVTRSGDVSGGGSVDYTVTGNGATADDFHLNALPGGTVVFAAGESSSTLTLDIQGDLDVEAAEGFTVTLSSPTAGATLGTAAAAGTILNDDSRLAISADQESRSEGDSGSTAFTFTVTRTGTEGSRTVDWAVTGTGTSPADAADFSGGQLPSGTVTFEDGESTRTITVGVGGDAAVEQDEDFTVTLSNASGNAGISTATADSTIDNDDVQIDIEIVADDAEKSEGDTGTTPFTFRVTRAGDSSGISTVDFVVSGAATNGATAADFNGNAFPAGTVTFNPDDVEALVTVLIAGDLAVESDEGFTVTLSNAINAEIVTASAGGTIQNDDASLSIAALDASQDEGDSGETTVYRFTVTRTGDSSGAADVNWSVSGAADADDFGGTLPSGTVSFAAGESVKEILVTVTGDDTAETDESFTVTLADASGATVATESAGSVIRNDDVLPITYGITADNATRNEAAGAFTFTVTRSGGTTVASTVDYTVTGSGTSAADADDFSGALPAGTVSFAAGQTAATLTVVVSNDADIESDESFTVTLGNAENSSADGTILNDDPEADRGVRLVDGVLIVTGNGDSEYVLVRGSRSQITVFTYNFASGERTLDRFRQSAVASISVDVGEGHDRVYLNGRIYQQSTIELGAGNDRAYGGRNRDVINGGDGSDAIYGRNGHDVIDGGDGNDYIRGGNHNDLIRAGGGSVNRIFGDRGADILVGGAGTDYLYGGGGRDILIGGGARDRVDGHGGDDILIGGSTVYDNDDAALTALMSVWSSNESYVNRVASVTTGSGSLNGVRLEAGTTVLDDDVRDVLIGRNGRDLFFRDVSGSDADRVFRSRRELFMELP